MTTEPKVFVGFPTYLLVHLQAVLGATNWSSQVPDRGRMLPMDGGFHCGNFNALLCACLNQNEFDGAGWTHFAMIHQDVDPVRWWIDRAVGVNEPIAKQLGIDPLTGLMDKYDVDVLSMVLPQKNDNGVTSTGALNKKTLCTRRLVVEEIDDYLPATFTSEDLAKLGLDNHLLLMSTGFWVMRLTGPWVDRVWFESPSRIIRTADGRRMSAVWDEGWNFSVQLAMMNRRYACTREIPAGHIGFYSWSNQGKWGEWRTDLGDMDYSWILGRPAGEPPPPRVEKPKIIT